MAAKNVINNPFKVAWISLAILRNGRDLEEWGGVSQILFDFEAASEELSNLQLIKRMEQKLI